MSTQILEKNSKSEIFSTKLMALAISVGFYTTAYATLIKLFFTDPPYVLLLLQYAIVAFFLGVYFKKTETFKRTQSVPFRSGLLRGAAFVLIAAAIHIALELIIFQIMPEATMHDKFGFANLKVPMGMAVFGGTFLEYLVLGNIAVFCWIQYLKRPLNPELL